MIALVRPGAWNFPLFLHVFGAIALFGTVLAVATLSVASRRRPALALLLRRTALVITLVGVWPAYVVMRIGAEWVLSREGLEENSPGWVGVGFAVSDAGIVVLLLLTLLGWLGLRRSRPGAWHAGLAVLYLVALGVAWFAMSAKPGA